MSSFTLFFIVPWTNFALLLFPGWKDTRNCHAPYLHVRAPINAIRLMFMRNLRARVN